MLEIAPDAPGAQRQDAAFQVEEVDEAEGCFRVGFGVCLPFAGRGWQQQDVAQMERAKINAVPVQFPDEARQFGQEHPDFFRGAREQGFQRLARQGTVETCGNAATCIQPEALKDFRGGDAQSFQRFHIPGKAPRQGPEPRKEQMPPGAKDLENQPIRAKDDLGPPNILLQNASLPKPGFQFPCCYNPHFTCP